ncbi:hypothetical protein SAMN04244573_03066 [Azotobacter beijerinckii]|uniref:Uncharacterized protein n=1 Tax=Azotobacter beijerinckii TaxID=170623 RepID=A0A1H9M703_9GAMM|nr:hypothetical protein [Azotobacter beijerinckii]SER19257.1 hypothetical protein SAMN04244573_03066 [Azotobacter beijerinckii]
MSKSTTHAAVNTAAADIADEALELLESTRERLDMLASLLRAIYRATPAVLVALGNNSRSGALDAQHLAGLGEQSAVEWSEYLEQQTEQLKGQLDAVGGEA